VVKPISPKSFDGPPGEAHRLAIAERAPVFVPAPVYADDRGWSVMNQLQGVMSAEGQINYSVTYPGVIKAWHRHSKQTDFWMCLSGMLKAGVWCPDTQRLWVCVMGERRPGILVIPPPLWHGAATVGHEPAGLLYYVTHAYDPKKPDEERAAWDAFGGFTWATEHR
jgi:dTDP-4-dehydrorhamnose 3,5-epimerase